MSENIPMIRSGCWYIRRDLEELKQEKWGWVIYRTGYKDDLAWSKFKGLLLQNTAYKVGKSDAPEIINNVDWVFMDDREIFDQAPREFLRRHFNEWADNAVVTENPRAEEEGLKRWTSPRYRMFVQVDDDDLWTITDGIDETVGIEAGLAGCVHLIDGKWMPQDDDAEEEIVEEDEEEEELEVIDGCKEENVGWMLVPANQVGPELYASIHGSRNAFYIRPPGVLDW